LHGAIDAIEVELETARERAEEAAAEYEAMKAATAGRIAEIRAKIAVLDPSDDDESPQPTEQPVTSPPTPAQATPRREAKGS
jgi:hypothetical protein